MILLGKPELSARPSARAEHTLLRVLTRVFGRAGSIRMTLNTVGYHAAR